MTIDERLAQIVNTQGELRDMQAQLSNALKGGDGGGNSGGMDERLNRLEGNFDKLREDNSQLRDRIASVSERVATLSEKVSHLPSKGWIDARLLGLLALIAAIVTFGEKLQSLVK